MGQALARRLQLQRIATLGAPGTLALAVGISLAWFGLFILVHSVYQGGDLLREERPMLLSSGVIAALLGYSAALALLGPLRMQAEFRALTALVPAQLRPRFEEFRAAIARAPVRPMMAAGAVFGVGIIPFFAGDPGLLFRTASWDVDLAWSALSNSLVFGLIARLGTTSRASDRFVDERITPAIEVDLLDPAPLTAFARIGVGTAMYWFIGSSIASLLFLNYGFSLLHAFILSVTLGVGTASLLGHMRGIHRRIVRAKREELEAVRASIREAREAALAPGSGAVEASTRLPGLLAWEQRVEAVSSWPIDLPSQLRFAALGTLAILSWVGGAVIERVLEAALP